MRFQSIESIDPEQLQQYAERFDSPKVERAVQRFLDVFSGDLVEKRVFGEQGI